MYGSAFLPASNQGARLSGGGQGLANLRHPRFSEAQQQRQLRYIQYLNRDFRVVDPAHPAMEGMIESYELAFRMQSSVPDLLDLRGEPATVQQFYGLGDRRTEAFGRQCLLARRMVERGVRFVQLTHRGWDHHNRLRANFQDRASEIDVPIAGLLEDLKRRDLLRDTLVVWGGEFGRSPTDQKGDRDSRGHNATGYSLWMAGGGVRGGLRYGTTNETGQRAVSGLMTIPDLHATILHLLGLNYERLTYRYFGRNFRLTNVSGNVAQGILA